MRKMFELNKDKQKILINDFFLPEMGVTGKSQQQQELKRSILRFDKTNIILPIWFVFCTENMAS